MRGHDVTRPDEDGDAGGTGGRGLGLLDRLDHRDGLLLELAHVGLTHLAHEARTQVLAERFRHFQFVVDLVKR